MKIEQPDPGRSRIYDGPDGLLVEIPARRNLFVIAFIGFWLCGWAFGAVAVSAQLLVGTAQGTLGPEAFFLIAWLGAWLVGGVLVVSVFLWGIAGVERIGVAGGVLAIERRIPI